MSNGGQRGHSLPAFAAEMSRNETERGKPNRPTQLDHVARKALGEWIIMVSPSDLAGSATSPSKEPREEPGTRNRYQP